MLEFSQIFFGGSFDPPHIGHLGVAKAVCIAFPNCTLYWVPSYLPPHKVGRKRAPFDLRLEMVKRTIGNLERNVASNFEGEKKLTPSYTYLVLDAWEEEFGTRPALLIGADSLLELHLWKNCKELVEKNHILTYPRNGYEITKEKLLSHWDEKLAEKLLSGVIPGEFFEISSTQIRKIMENSHCREHINKENLNESVLPEVAKLISNEHLYEI